MISETTESFRRQLREAPTAVRSLAHQIYRLWSSNPRHPSLQFKRIHHSEPIYSVRIGIQWRAVCVVDENTAVWFWIGSHAAYDALIKIVTETVIMKSVPQPANACDALQRACLAAL